METPDIGGRAESDTKAEEGGDESGAAPMAEVGSRTAQLRKRVEQEADAATSRAQRMANLSSDLKK